MLPQLEKLYQKLEKERQQLLTIIAGHSHEQQNFKSAPESWSMLEVCQHLIKAEGNTVIYLNKKYLGVDKTPQAGIGAIFRTKLLNAALDMPVRYKAPKAAQIETSQSEHLFNDTKQEWDTIREDLTVFLNQLTVEQSTKLLFKHLLGGRLNMLQALSFMQHHIRHHNKQVGRIQKNPKFPKG